MINEIIDKYPEDEFLVADGLDEAIIGVDERGMVLIYSVSKCIDVLMGSDGMTEDDAIEFFEYNVRGAYVGEKTPTWCDDRF